MKKFLLLLLLLSIHTSAFAGITFHVKSTDRTAFRCAGSCAFGPALGNAAVEASALPGAFGGSVINMVGAKGLSWLPRLNLPSGAITILVRFAPAVTGGGAGSILNVNNGYGAWYAGIRWTQGAGNTSNVLFRNTNADIVYNDTLGAGTMGYVADQFMDAWLSWDGTPGANKINLYVGQNGQVPTLVGSGFAGAANNRDTAVSGSVMIGADPFINGLNGLLNEFVMWDEVIDPTTFGARTDFIPDTAFDGANTTDPGEANVLLGTGYFTRGVAKTGILVVPTLANTKIGIAGNGGTGTYDGSDRWSCPAAGNLLDIEDLMCNSTTPNLTGTYSAPDPSEVEIGVAVGASVGTYTGANRWTCPIASQLSAGVQLQCSSLTNNLLGTRNTVTNLIKNATIKGGNYEAVLKVR